jgi:heterodisulfide reductase subunit A
VKNHPKIEVITEGNLKSVYGFVGNFEIGIDTKSGPRNLKVGTIIVAVGSELLDPQGHYLYGEDPRVITQVQLEELHKKGKIDANRIAMLQCASGRKRAPAVGLNNEN